MLMIVTNKADYTADFLVLALKDYEIEFVRFNTEDFPLSIQVSIDLSSSRNVDGYFVVYEKPILFSDISSIWYRRPLTTSFSNSPVDPIVQDFITVESRYTLDSIWRILPCFWVSHPDKLRAAEAKLHQLITASQLGLTIPDTLLTTIPDKARSFYFSHRKKVIYKPQRYTQIQRPDRTQLIYTNVLGENDVKYFGDVNVAPSLFQTYIQKSSELRITVIGDQCLTVQIHSQENFSSVNDWRRANSTEVRHTPYDLPAHISQKCVSMVRHYGLAFGAIDMIITPDGEYVFLEMNPNGQWAWIEQLCPEIAIRKALIELLLMAGKKSDE